MATPSPTLTAVGLQTLQDTAAMVRAVIVDPSTFPAVQATVPATDDAVAMTALFAATILIRSGMPQDAALEIVNDVVSVLADGVLDVTAPRKGVVPDGR